MPVSLSDFDSMLDAATLERLGDPILYTPSGAGVGSPIPMKAFVDHSEGVESYGATGVIVGERTIELLKTLVPARPDAQCVVHLVGLGQDFTPIDPRSDESGNWWVCKLKLKR